MVSRFILCFGGKGNFEGL